MFHQRIGTPPSAPTQLMIQKPGRSNSPRCSRLVSRKRATDGTKTTMLYLASTPSAMTTPAAVHAQREPWKMARCVSTSAQPQQQQYGESMVISDDPAVIIGMVSAISTTASA